MTLTAPETWTRLLDQARLQLPEQTYKTWLEPIEAISLDGETLYVGAPDQFAADWNESKHADLLASFAPIALGHPIRVVFRVPEDRRTRQQMDLFVAQPAQPGTSTATRSATVPPLNERYTFDYFVIGKSNELAAATAHGVAQAPGKAYNPLFIYGDTGLGKTHLMQAIAHEILVSHPETRITYIGTEQFTNELVAAIQNRTNAEFRRRFRQTDLLLVDDVHFLKGKESTQEEFFHTFNALYEAGRQIVLTSDRPPSEISGLESRLVSRFQWGMVADIELPDLEHRIAILRQKAAHDALTIPDEVLRFIAEHVRSSVRELEGSIIKLLAFASLRHREISIDVAREALRDKLRASLPGTDATPSLTTLTIQQIVAKEWGVTADGLRSKTRTKTLTVPRQVAMHLMRSILGMQLVEIGSAFGGRDHSTVIHSLDRVVDMVNSDPEFAKRVARIDTHLRGLTQS